MKVAVLKGGRSLERGVSLRSGARVEDALERLGHEVVSLDVGGDLVPRLREARPEVAFIALHGPDGEDGTVQELLEILGIPFTGPGAAACARCMDKVQAKDAIELVGLPTPHWFAFNQTAFREFGAGDALGRLEKTLGFPLVVKPSRGGNSMRLNFSGSNQDEIREGVRRIGRVVSEQVALYETLTHQVAPQDDPDEGPAGGEVVPMRPRREEKR